MWHQLSIQRLTVAILFILLFAMATRTPVDTDTWWHLRSGAYQLEHRTVIGADLFSHTRFGEPWINHSWGSQIVMYVVYAVFGGQGLPGDGGNIGLALLTAALATGGMALVYLASPGSVYVRAFVVVLGAAAAAVFWSPRPQMFTFFFSAVVYYLLHLYKRQGLDRLWWIPVVMMIWGNMHGGFAIGFILMVGFVSGEVAGNLFDPGGPDVIPWRGIGRLVLVMVVSGAALVINPFGFGILRVPLETVNIGVLQDFIEEWASPDFHQRQTWPFILLLLGALGVAGLSRERLDWTDLALVAGTAVMSLLAGRNIAVFAVVATPVMARHVDAFLADHGWQIRPVTRPSPAMARLNWVLLLVVALGGLAKVYVAVNPETVTEAQIKNLPVQAAEYINTERPAGLMFNSYNWGGYLMFAAPGFPVFVDGRTDLYGDEFLSEYLNVLLVSDGWRETLDKYGVSWVVIERRSVLARVLRDEPGWRAVYEDELAALFVREAQG